MSRARHKARAKGGAVAYSGGDSNVMKEAHERKRGGKVEHMHGEGEGGKHHHDRKRRRGGKVEHEKHKDGGEKHHEKMHMHKGRARGGKIGANRMPLSTAATIKEVTKGESAEDMGQH